MTTPKITHSADLEFKSGSSDKVYHVWIENVGANHTVKFKYGRRGSTLNEGTKVGPTHEAEARKAYDRIVTEKMGKGYTAMPLTMKAAIGSPAVTSTMPAATAAVIAKMVKAGMVGVQLLNPFTEELLESYLQDPRYILQEKKDGKRMVLGRKKGELQAFNRNGMEITMPTEYAAAIISSFGDMEFMIDGEACGPVFWAFDIMALESSRCVESDYADRLLTLGMLMRSIGKQNVIKEVMTYEGKRAKHAGFEAIKKARGEGVVFKDTTAKYTLGRPNSLGPQLKYKFIASCTCGVIDNKKGKRSVGLVMISNSGGRHPLEVGNVTIPVNYDMPVSGEVVEVEYLYAYPGGSLYQPVYKGKRDDVEIDFIETLKLKQEVE